MLARTLNAAADTAESVAQALKDHPTQPDVVADTVWAHMWTDRRQRQVRGLCFFLHRLVTHTHSHTHTHTHVVAHTGWGSTCGPIAANDRSDRSLLSSDP